MDNRHQENSAKAADELSKDCERFCNWQELQSDKLKAFQNFLTEEDWSELRNSTDHDQTVRVALKCYIHTKRKVTVHSHPHDDPIYEQSANGAGTLLHAAFKAGYYDVVNFALTDYRGNFYPSSKDDMIHFHIACVTKNLEAVENFLKGGIDPNEPLNLDSDEYCGLRPVELAIENHYLELFVMLVRYGANLSTKNARGLSPLQMIYHSNLPNNGKCWFWNAFKHGYDFKFDDCKDDYGVSHLHLLCILGEPSFVRAFISGGTNVNDSISEKCPSNPGFTPLHFAVVNNSFFVAVVLMQNGADPNKSDANGRTPLHYACEMPMESSAFTLTPLRLVKYLVIFRANPSAVDKKGFTPLHLSFYAAKEGTWDIFDFLIGRVETKFNYTDEHGLSLFHMACSQSWVAIIVNLLNSGVDVNEPVSSGIYSGLTALHFAAMHYRKGVIEVLLDRGANANVKDDEVNFTPLHYACEQYDPSDEWNGVQMMLKWKASPLIVDKKGRTPLHVIFYRSIDEDLEMVDKLSSHIEWGTDTCTDQKGVSLFHIACSTSDVNQVVKFLNSGVNVDSCPFSGSLSGFTPLHLAVMYQRRDVVKILLERNAKVNEKSDVHGVTPLHLACEFRDRSLFDLNEMVEVECYTNPVEMIIKLLLSHGADVNAEDSHGSTPLLHLCEIDKNYSVTNVMKLGDKLEAIVKILISNKADVNARNANQSTILHILSEQALLKTSENFFEFLVMSGANVNAVDSAGSTPLHVAVENTNLGFVRSLLKFGANPNVKCSKSRIPLHIIAEQLLSRPEQIFYSGSSKEILFALLDNNSDVNVRNQYDGILLHNAIRDCNSFLTENLLKYGADLNTEDSSGNIPVYCLSQKQHDNRIRWDTVRVILVRIKWLEALELPVSKKVQDSCFCLYFFYATEQVQGFDAGTSPNEMYIKYCAELDVMRNIKIDSYTSLYNVLRKCPHDLVNHVENKNLIEIVNDENLEEKFPFYSHWLKLQFKKGLIRKNVARSADVALCNVLNQNLPTLCRDAVLKYLTNEEVAALISAAPVDKALDESCKQS